jgi:hypothetical protein
MKYDPCDLSADEHSIRKKTASNRWLDEVIDMDFKFRVLYKSILPAGNRK